MAVNYNPTGTFIETTLRHGTIAAGTGAIRRMAYVPNGTSSCIFVLRNATTHFLYKFDPDGTLPSAVTATFSSGVSLSSALSLRPFLHINGANSYLLVPEGTNNILRVYKFDVASVSGTFATGSAHTSYTAAGGTRSAAFYRNGNFGYIFLATAVTTASILYWKVDLTTAWTLGSPTATFNGGYSCNDLAFYYNGTSSILANLDTSTGRINTWVIDPDTITGTITTASRAGVYTTGTSPLDLSYYQNGTDGYFFARRTAGGAGAIVYYKANPTVVQTLTTPTATFTTGATSGAIDFIYNGPQSYLLAPDQVANRSDCFRFDPDTVTSTEINPTFSFECDYSPQAAVGVISGSLAYIFSSEDSVSGTDQLSLYRTTFNERSLGVVQSAYYTLDSSAPIRKISGGTLTLYSEIDYFTASQLLRFGADETESGLGTTVFGYQFTTVSDTTGTIGEDFIFSGATAGVTGNYRLTMGSSTTLTLSSKGTYSDSFTVPATGTLVIVQDTTLGEEFILSAGTTVNKSGAGPYTLTIPYPDPGLVLGSGIILSAPTADVTATNFADGTRVQVAHRQIFSPTSADINTTSDYITIGTDSNGDSPSFSSSPRTLVRFNLESGATIPTTSPQIIDGGLYYADLSGSNLSLRITSSGSNIDFISQGSGSFQLIAETEKDNSVVAGGSGYSYTLTLSNNALVRVKAIHWTETAGSASSTPLFDQVYAWSSTTGIPVIDVVDNTDPDSQDSIHEQLVAISSIQLEGQVIDNAGTPITSITLPDSGQSVTGLSFALEGVGKVQVNANDSNGILTWQELYLWGRYVQSTSAGIRISSSTTFIATSLNNYVITSLEFDNISSSALQVVGGIGKSSDGAACVSTLTTGSVILNAVNQGTGAVITTGGSALTPTESGYLTAINTKTSELYRRQGMEIGVTASEKDAETGTPGYLTTSDGLIDQTITKNVDGSVTINRN